MDEISVRPAVREDCKGIRSLIQQLANFEDMSNGPKIGADTLEKDGFGPHPLFHCVVAEKNSTLIGYALFYFTYSTWVGKSMYLEDLFVIPDCRMQGVGSLLFDAVAKKAVDENCGRLDFAVLKWNPATNFYKHRGAIDMTEAEDWHYYRLGSEGLRERFWHAIKMASDNRKSISQKRWGDCVLDSDFWEESDELMFTIKETPEFVLSEEERKGILTDRLIEGRLNRLAKCPHDGSYALTKCNLSHMDLVDITQLQQYTYLQYLNLSHNNLGDLSVLGNCPYLLYLDASHNDLTSLSLFPSPLYLTYLDLSYNKIDTMNDMSEFWSIVYLDLSHNSIEIISGLQKLRHLKHLNLSHNIIDCVQNLDDLNIENLNLEFNRITKFRSSSGEGLENLRKLRTLLLNHNKIASLFFLHNGFYSLRILDLRHNKIGDLLSVSNTRAFLYEINLRGNSCTTWPYYREVLLHSIPTLTWIDECEVTIPERVSALAKFNPPVDLLSSKALSRLNLLEHLIPPRIDESVVPYDQFDPALIVLSGPSAVKKILLGLLIAKRMSDKVKYCRSYTTREFSAHQDEVKAYKFVEREDFNTMARNGEFLTVEELVGDSYGFHAGEIAALQKAKKIGITQMDLGATIQLKHRYPNVKLILVMTKNEEIHREWIREKFKIFTWIKDSIENLLALTIGRLSKENHVETPVSRVNFISQIISEIIQDLDLPNYCNYVRPQGTGATAMDIILQSRMMLRPVIKTTKEVIGERHIQFEEDNGRGGVVENASAAVFSDLKVVLASKEGLLTDYLHPPIRRQFQIILDEQKNIIIDDDESKKQRRTKRFLHRRKAFEEKGEVSTDMMSESSDESHYRFFDKFKRTDEAKYLMNYYVEVVMKSRQVYIDKHLRDPGFYSLTVYSDQYEEALSALFQFINAQVDRKSEKCENPDIKYRNEVIVPKIISNVLNELNTNLFTRDI
ncbi:LOW QUALITY PROTEIN: uncharacterized protein LOC135162617 [Diachasmimorpha longicaudata]|uniref:LOW QUALITY PROTEIN: uncharacterized protein LOC135162617 n=1 Tax=Diachasmimorpha longicaudata TaxID=58733 RepID=UPI0030B86B85